ncbi:MAG: hypothetical protein EZS28_027973 [Streblomastix strix]|uniref:Uncharacterized protein n=1 Tax=Streblomastix strix TaxID=222440 RepID=A0A5J4V272_9EUKA|nr:MAG: hypothetical protein EZS28_027973 [Streblomastix strix]
MPVWGLAAKFYEKVNISPSFTWLLANAPTRRIYKDKPEGADSTWNDLDLEYTCDRNDHEYDYMSPVRQKFGVVDAQCFPNDVPNSLTTCKGTSAAPKPLLQGYTEGRFGGDFDTLKSILLRFGPVMGYNQIVIGWEKKQGRNLMKVIITKDNPDSVEEFTLQKVLLQDTPVYGGSFYFDPGLYKKIDCATELTVTTTADECPCFDKKTDKEAYDADIRKDGICKGASGSVRAQLAVVAVVLFTPILAMFW